jgi:hypothetical protein
VIDSCEQHHLFGDNPPGFIHFTPEGRTFAVLGEGWALGIEHLDKSVPWEILITRRPLPGSRPLPP